MVERTHISGVLEGREGELLYVDASITVGDETFSARKPARSLELRASSGRVYALSGFDHSKKTGRIELKGRWGELRPRHDFLALVDASKIRKEATEITVRAFVLRAGEHIEAEVTETGRAGAVIEARVRKISVERDSDASKQSPPSRGDAPSKPSSRPHRVVGTLLGDAGAIHFARLWLTAGTSKEQCLADGRSVEVRTDNGERVRIENIHTAAHLGKVSVEGRFGAIADDPLAKLFARQAPGDHVAVEIEGFALRAGDRVAVEGFVSEESLVDNPDAQGFRGAPNTVVTAIEATRIAIGADAEALLDVREAPKSPPRSAPDMPRPRAPLARSTFAYATVGTALALGSLVAGWLAPMTAARAWITPASGLGVAMLLIALNRRLRAAHHASYVSRAGGGARLTPKSAVWGYQADIVILIAYALCVPMSALVIAPHVVTAFYGALLVFTLMHATLLAVQEAPFRRFASLVLGARAEDPRAGRTVLVEGTVRSEGAALVRTVDFFWQTETTYSTDADGNQQEHNRSTLFDREHTSAKASSFTVESSASSGAILVEPARAHTAFSKRAWKSTGEVSPYTESLSHGDPVCIVARFDDEAGTLVARARGEESMFLWAGTRAQLVAARWAAYGRIALILCASIVPIALGTRVFPFAARYHASATVTTSTANAIAQGARCELSVLAYRDSIRGHCKLTLVCDGARLYGGWAMGQTECSVPERPTDLEVSGSDTSTSDGDPAIEFNLRERTLVWRDDKSAGAATIALDPVSSALSL